MPITECANRSMLLPKLLVLSIAGVLVLLIWILPAIIPQCTSKICLNKECKNKASDLLKRMDLQVEPCKDFYKFACGSVITRKQNYNDGYTELRQTVAKQLSELIMIPKRKQRCRYLTLPHLFYKACANQEEIIRLDLQPVKDILKQLNKWPYLCNDCGDTVYWPDLIRDAQRLGLETNYIISFGLEMHPKNSEKLVMTINKPSFSLEPTHFLKGFKHPEVNALYESLVKMAIKLNAPSERIDSAVYDALVFEINLATISLDSSPDNITDGVGSPHNLLSIKTIQSILPYLNWLEYINGLLPDNYRVNESEIILVRSKSYFMQLGSILEKTNLSTICNYLTLRIIQYSIPFLPDKFLLMRSPLQANKSSSDSLPFSKAESRESQCLSIIPQLFPVIVGALYSRQYNNMDSKNKATEIFENIKMEIWHALQHTTWLNETELVPLGILQGQFFNPYLPKYLNYGTLGYALAHEIVHGFDNVGSKYDSNGNESDGWHSESNQDFVRMTQCLIRQYGNFQDETTLLHLDGERTLTENIADNGGLRQTYNAYKRWASRHFPEIKLPSLNFTPEQLFWISGAQLWCKVLNNGMDYRYCDSLILILNTFRLETLYKQWQEKTHSPYVCRVLGPLRNMPEFSQDFNCPEGSPMNPPIKCYVW
uniref:Peptidase M13 C-terminal domain-containing protein n=1 Tax=Glossina brevipalpis TaxID=37001 RepID=A0A1A9X1W6_9MUSC